MRSRKTSCIFGAVALVVVLIVAAAGLFFYGRAQLGPVSSNSAPTVDITVSSGETLDSVKADLDKHGLIRSSFWFGLYAGYRGLASKLRAGQFHLDAAMGASEVVAKLEGPPDAGIHKLVLTEGMTAAQMADRVAALNIGVSSQQYLNEVNSGTFTESFLAGKPAGVSLEGFLFPDTYEIPDGSTAHSIVNMQLQDFGTKAEAVLTGTSQNQYSQLIIASMIEREAKFPADLPLVSSVIANRMAQGMKLELDTTVMYGLNINVPSLTAAEIATDTPYNTYIHTGLPPTPISNPGVSAMNAAVHPASTDYLYYVSDSAGHIYYSATAAEHCIQVQKYVGTAC